MGMDRMSGFDRMGGNMEMTRSFSQFGGSSGHMGGDRGAGSKGGCQIFVRNVSISVISCLFLDHCRIMPVLTKPVLPLTAFL